MIEKLLKEYRFRKTDVKPNYRLIPVNLIEINEKGMDEFNEIYYWMLNEKSHVRKIVRTNSGGISIDRRNFRGEAWDLRKTTSCIEMTIILKEGMWRFQFRNKLAESDKIALSGSNGFKMFKELCQKNGIDLKDYEIDNGEEVKKEIEKPLICLDKAQTGVIYKNVNHIDFHNSYPAGLVNIHEEFRPVVEKLYEERKVKPENKLILNVTIGYMQSLKCCGAKWAHLSRDAIKDNNDRIKELAMRLRANGRQILAFNTDGIWYRGEIYHGEGEGDKLGQWENDHVNCVIRFKSAGSYEYLEDGKCHPVVRGYTKLDEIKPRDEWEWGDIFKIEAAPKIFEWDDEEGIKII